MVFRAPNGCQRCVTYTSQYHLEVCLVFLRYIVLWLYLGMWDRNIGKYQRLYGAQESSAPDSMCFTFLLGWAPFGKACRDESHLNTSRNPLFLQGLYKFYAGFHNMDLQKWLWLVKAVRAFRPCHPGPAAQGKAMKRRSNQRGGQDKGSAESKACRILMFTWSSGPLTKSACSFDDH